MNLEEVERRLAELDRERRELLKIAEQLREAQEKLPLRFQDVPATTLNKVPTTPEEKVELFASLFRGRTDVFAIRWERKKSSGYFPACANRGTSNCGLFRGVRCNQCGFRSNLPISNQILKEHLQGKRIVGVYPIIKGNHCRFCVIDFDEENWRDDAKLVLSVARRKGIPFYPEISRSGNGVHLWIFFSEEVLASLARSLCDRVLALAMEDPESEIQLKSFDRIIPCQDSVQAASLGNLIALPLQWKSREIGGSVFCSDDLVPLKNQWQFLSSVKKWSEADLNVWLERNSVHRRIQNKTQVTALLPWEKEDAEVIPLADRPLEKIRIDVADKIYLEERPLSTRLRQRLIRLVSYQNPKFFSLQASHRPVYKTPRFLSLAETFNEYLALPRGVLSVVLELFDKNKIEYDLCDHRTTEPIEGCEFCGTLRPEQKKVFLELEKTENSILVASTGFGKTVLTAALIAKRSVRTLVLMHNKELLLQWKDSLENWLGKCSGDIGVWYGGRHQKTNYIDIALFQSIANLSEQEQREFLKPYGFVVVDECHHLASANFSQVFSLTQSRYVLGLTATLMRQDGQERLVKYLCGQKVVRFKGARPFLVQLFPLVFTQTPKQEDEENFTEYLGRIAKDNERNAWIVEKIVSEYASGRKILVLTGRVDQQKKIAGALAPRIKNLFVLRPTTKKAETGMMAKMLRELSDDLPRVLVATGKLAGEGFDYPILDTLFLALPFAWKGTLTQYIGRIAREHSDKRSVRIYDVVDEGCPVLVSMWNKRKRGYAINDIVPTQEEDLFREVAL